MRNFVLKSLKLLSRLLIKKYNPQIIGVAGSVGKTSSKEAIFSVLAYQHTVRRSIENYNNEFGVPLTIIGAAAGGRNIRKWLVVYYRAIKQLLWRNRSYPEILVLEMGVDKRGDMEYLLDIVSPRIGVLTAIGEEHLQELKDIKGVLREEEGIVTKLRGKEKRAILNRDDEDVMSLSVADKIKVDSITYGFSEDADVVGREMVISGMDIKTCDSQYEWDCKVWGTGFKVSYAGSTVPVFLPHCFGKQHIYAALAGIAVGVLYKMNLVDISEGLRQYRSPKGRMRVLAGIKHTLLIDDTYNSSPKAVHMALAMLEDLRVQDAAKKIAVLGDMLELGDLEESTHREVGFKVAEHGITHLVTVGPASQFTAQAAIEAGLDSRNVTSFDTSEQAGRFVQDLMKEGDIVLVKGSRGKHMEKVVKEVMAEPELADDLLVGLKTYEERRT